MLNALKKKKEFVWGCYERFNRRDKSRSCPLKEE